MATIAAPARAKGRPRLYLAVGLAAAPIALIGFAKTFFAPLVAGTFSAHPLVYGHGALLFGWVGFFILQSTLIHRRGLRWHRRMGWVGLALAIGVVLSTIAVGVLASRRVAATGAIAQANAELLVIQLEMLIFSCLIGLAIWKRAKPELHKRLMLLALIGALGPAWFRFRHYFPPVENPAFFYSVLIADSLIVLAALVDRARFGRIHPVYLIAGPVILGIHLVEVFAFGAPLFQRLALAIAAPLI